MSSTSEHAVVSALEAALRDQGWAAAGDPARLRALLSDLLGAQADEHRGALDAIVISAEEGIPADLQAAGRSGVAEARPALIARLQDWGLTPDRAAWVVTAWEPLVPEVTTPPAPALPPPPATELPPSASPEPTSPAPAVTMPPTELPPPDAPATPAPQIEPTVLPPTSLPNSSPAATALPADEAPEQTRLPIEPQPQPQPQPQSEPSSQSQSQSESQPAPPVVEVPDEDRRRPRWPLVAAAVLVLALGGGAFAALNGSGGEDPPEGGPTTEAEATASGEILSAPDATPAQASSEFAMAGKDGGVRITALGTVDQVTIDAAARVAAEGEDLLAFTLATGPCEARPCSGWDELGLTVAVDGSTQPLPAGGPTFVVSASGAAPVELVLDSDGVEQRLSLRDGAPAADNIEVLMRTDRRVRIGERKPIEPTATNLDGSPLSFTLAGTKMTATAKSAELFFFGDHDPPQSTDEAYLRVDLSYTRGGSTNPFEPSRLVTFEADGETYPLLDLAPGNRFAGAFLVPADLRTGTLVVQGSREVPTVGGQSYLETIPRTTFRVRF